MMIVVWFVMCVLLASASWQSVLRLVMGLVMSAA